MRFCRIPAVSIYRGHRLPRQDQQRIVAVYHPATVINDIYGGDLKNRARFLVEVIKAVRYVDNAILGNEKDIFKPIEKIRPDIIALGKNQDIDEKFLQEELKKRHLKAKVVRIRKHFDSELNSTQKIITKIKN